MQQNQKTKLNVYISKDFLHYKGTMKEDLNPNLSFSYHRGCRETLLFSLVQFNWNLMPPCTLAGRGGNTSHLNLCRVSKTQGTVLFTTVRPLLTNKCP